VTGNSDVRNIRCTDNLNQNDIDTTNSRPICEISAPRNNKAQNFVALGLDEVFRVT